MKIILALLGAALALPSPAQAQDWPSKPITMMVSFTAGSSIDVAGRIVAARMADILVHDRLVKNLGHPRRHDAGRDVDRAAGRE